MEFPRLRPLYFIENGTYLCVPPDIALLHTLFRRFCRYFCDHWASGFSHESVELISTQNRIDSIETQ